MKESVDGILKLGKPVAVFYYGEDEMDSYGHPAMVTVGLDVEGVESHEQFQTDYTAIEVLKLPTPPNLLAITLKEGRKFLAHWLKRFLGPSPGYGKSDRKPSWWPGSWEKSPQLAGTKHIYSRSLLHSTNTMRR